MAAAKAFLEKIPMWARILAAFATLLISFIAGIFAMYHFSVGDLPALKESLATMSAEIRGFRNDLNAMDQRQRADLSATATRQLSSLDRLDTSQRALRAHVIVLIKKVEKRDLNANEYKDLMSSIRDISTTEATNLTGRSVVSGPEVPEVPKSVFAAYKKGVIPSDVWRTFDLSSVSGSKPGLDKFLAASFLLKNGKWQAMDKSIKFLYDGGSSEYFFKKPVTKTEIEKTVELFNSVSDLGAYATMKDAAATWPR